MASSPGTVEECCAALNEHRGNSTQQFKLLKTLEAVLLRTPKKAMRDLLSLMERAVVPIILEDGPTPLVRRAITACFVAAFSKGTGRCAFRWGGAAGGLLLLRLLRPPPLLLLPVLLLRVACVLLLPLLPLVLLLLLLPMGLPCCPAVPAAARLPWAPPNAA